MIVLHAFAPSTPAVRQQRTWRVLEQLRRHGRYVVVDYPVIADTDYAAAIDWCWNPSRPLCVLEHDVVPRLEDLVALERCTASHICTQAVPVGGSFGAGVVDDRYLFRVRPNDGSLRWGLPTDQWADAFPLACTVFKPSLMASIAQLDLLGRHWHDLDHWVSLKLAMRAHVHWPALEHLH